MKLNRHLTRPNHAIIAIALIFGASIAIPVILYFAFVMADYFQDNRAFLCWNIGLLVGAVMAGIWMIKTKRI